MHDGGVEYLPESWLALISRHSDSPDAEAAGQSLVAAWSEPHRTYHSVDHLREILARIDDLADVAEDVDAVRLAAWYHDVVYAGLPDDEERSARRAEEDLSRLGLPAALVDEVARLVRMTVTHDPAPGDRNGEVLSDADLAALAAPRERYRANSAAIRNEYHHISDEAFRKGRIQVLGVLLGGSGVFRTEPGRRHWEAAARENMRAEMAELSQ